MTRTTVVFSFQATTLESNNKHLSRGKNIKNYIKNGVKRNTAKSDIGSLKQLYERKIHTPPFKRTLVSHVVAAM